MYYVINVESGIEAFKPDFFERVERWLLVSLIVELCFYTSLISIKLSFLFFFWRLCSVINYFKYIWWAVLFCSLASYLGSVGDVNYKCLVGPVDTILGECNAPELIDWTNMTLKVNCAFDVFTDFLIMLLPAILLWNVRIRWSKKLALLALFSLSIITMVIAIVRTATIVLNRRPDGNDDVSYLWLWSAIEPPVAIIVSCLSAFPQLFTQSSRKQRPAFTPSDTYLKMISRIRRRKRHPGEGDTWVNLTTVSQSQDFDCSRVAPDLEASSQRTEDSGQPVLVPNMSRPIVHAYKGEFQGQIAGLENGITKQFEFGVTKQPGAGINRREPPY
ncbi:hypothetical protein GGS26DRAFT_591351 [Hypomontagnella submonticulosa]|nr:hypothetical protein GGS26DRAFT_591351 [Hypomontagnella submonticulosa]